MHKATTSKNPRRSPRAIPKSTSNSCKNVGKRKAKESATVPEPKQKCVEKSPDGRNIDRYCWLCHKSDERSQEKYCSLCPRVYHTSCLERMSSKFSDKNVCPECQITSINGLKVSKCLTVQKLKELLLAITEQKLSNKKLKKPKQIYRWPQNVGDTEIVNVMDFEMLIDKINDIVPYTKTSEFFSDLKWIQHNCIILFGPTSDVSDAATKLVKSFKTELLDLEACPECYYHMLHSNSKHFLVRVCDPPHDIVWAKVSGHPYWPAKCLNIINEVAHVRFFGTHDLSDVPVSQCYFISKEHPNSPPKRPKYTDSLKELSEYIDLFETKFGPFSFHFYGKKTAFNLENAAAKPIAPVESDPTSSKPDVRNLQLHLGQLDTTSYDCSTTSAGNSSDAVTVNMTFSEEQTRTVVDLEPPEPFNTPSAMQSNNFRQFSEAATVQTAAVLASSSSTTDLQGKDSHNNVAPTNNDESSSEVTQTASATDEEQISEDINSVPSTSRSSDASSVPLNRAHVVEEFNFNQNMRALIPTYNARTDLNTIVSDLESCKTKFAESQIENRNLRVVLCKRDEYVDFLSKERTNLEQSVREKERENERLQREFDDATKNAKFVINSIKRENNKYGLEKYQKDGTMYSQKEQEKIEKIAELQNLVNIWKTRYNALERKNELEKMKQNEVSLEQTLNAGS